MLEKADEILKLALAAAALLIGASVSYYYAAFLPEKARQEESRLAQADKNKRETEAKLATDKENAKKASKENYEQCLSFAFSDYSGRWAASCKRINKEDIARKNNCYSNGYDYCDQIKITPPSDCSLPGQLADDYDKTHGDAKKLCLEEFKASS